MSKHGQFMSAPNSNGSQREGGPSQYRPFTSGIRSPARSETNRIL